MRRMTFNVSARADASLAELRERLGCDATTAINGALTLAARVHRLAPDGYLTIVQPDGGRVVVMLP